MNFSKIHVVGGPLVLATDAQVTSAQQELWVTFPNGYREYVTELGEGLLGNAFIRIYPPWRILSELEDWRARIRRHWLWDKGRKCLPKERAVESVIVGDTVNGDELVFHPGRSDHLFVLPRENDKIYDAGPDLMTAIEWMCESGKLTKRFAERDFKPFDRRSKNTRAKRSSEKKAETDDSLDATATALQKWAKQHGLLKAAEASFREWLAEETQPIFGMERKEVTKDQVIVQLKDQVLVFQPEKHQQPCVLSTLIMKDAETGFYFGEFQLQTSLNGNNDGFIAKLMHPHIKALAKRFFKVALP